ncbi:hypothetical protein D9M70_411790 [compost metagenome]
MHVGDVHAIARGALAIDVDVDVASASQAFGKGGGHARNRLGGLLDGLGRLVDFIKIRSGDLHANRAFDTCGQHVDPVANRRNPDVGQTRHPDHAIQLLDESFAGHPRAPLIPGLEAYRGLEHLQRCGVGGGLGSSSLAEDPVDLGNGPDQAVGLLQQLGGLLRGQAGQGRGHVEQVTFIQRRQELAAQAREGPERGEEGQQGHDQGGPGIAQYGIQRRLVEANQPTVERIALFGRQPAPYPVPHQDRNQRHRQTRRRRHRVGLGEGEWPEQATFLGLEGEYGYERQGDDHQAEEQRRAHFDRRIGHHAPVLLALQGFAGVVGAPGFDALVGVFDHHHRRVDHGADGDGDPAEGHDVGVDALVAHDRECDQHPYRQRDDGDHGRAQVPEERGADQGDDDELLDQLLAQVEHGPLDQLAAVVGGDDLNAVGEAFLQLFELGLHGGDGVAGILAAAQDHHAADGFPFAIEFGNAPSHLRSELDGRHIAQRDRGALGRQLQRHGAEVGEGFQVAGRPDHEFGLAKLQYRTAGFLVGFADGFGHLVLGNSQGCKADRVHLNLVLPDHAAHRGDLGHIGQGLQLELEEPVLQRPQLRQVVGAAAVHQRVLEDPADPGGIRAQGGLGGGRQAALHLAQVFEYP